IRAVGAQVCDGTNVTALATASCQGTTIPRIALQVDCPATPPAQGEMFFYSGSVSNSGDVTVSDLIVADDKSGLLMHVASLAPTETADFFGFYLATNCGPNMVTRVTVIGPDACSGISVSNQFNASCSVICPGALVLVNPTANGG